MRHDTRAFWGPSTRAATVSARSLLWSEKRAGTPRERMVAEKIFALWMLPLAMVSPMPTLDPAVAAQRSLAHFGKTVRSNRRRLSR